MKFQKKPIIIEAMQYLCAGSIIQIPAGVCNCGGLPIHVHTLEGILSVKNTDWVITGIKGEKYPVRDDIFRESYERVFE